MKKSILLATAALVLPTALSAQSAIDAYNISTGELRGTARFMSMAGAFTALGGDLSSLNQNPAGIGVYRGSDIGITLDINMMNSKTADIGSPFARSQTHADVNNFGYVGTYNLGGSTAVTLSWGASYSRLASFHRRYQGGDMAMQTSLSNYITTFTDGIDTSYLNFVDGYNPYQDRSENAAPWLSILAYNSGMITPLSSVDDNGQNHDTSIYDGLWQYPVDGQPQIRPTTGSAGMEVDERGYVDEYTIDFGGSVANVFYWGIGLGITDLSLTQNAYYGEDLLNANVPANAASGIEEGNGGFGLLNWRHTSGTGFNAKFGVILKPVNELRIGLAVHTPTYWSLSTNYTGDTEFDYSSGINGSEYTDEAAYDWRLNSPWKLTAGIAGVIGGRGILSVDYEYQAFGDMKTKNDRGYDYDYYNDDIKSYFKSSNMIRVGGEFRVTPNFSVRAGYAYQSTNVKDDVKDSNVEVYTMGTNPAYTLDSDTQYITCGLGYRISGFYIDAAYVHKHRSSTYHAFTSFKDYDGYWYDAPQAKVTDNNSQLVFTVGYKF
jgi:hypothetical protein